MSNTATKSKSPVQGRGDLASGGFTYPARLVSGSQEQQESGDWRLRLVFDRLDRIWSDTGKNIQAFVSFLTTVHGEPVWEGSDASTVADSFFNATGEGLDILDDDSIEAYIGHAFMLTDEDTGRTYTDKNGRERKAYLTTCIEYLGDENFEYAGKVTTVQSTNAAPSEEQSAADVPAMLTALFDGQSIADLKAGAALDMVKDNPDFAEIKETVLGKPLRGGLCKPKAVLIDLLIENGYATDEDGIFTAVE